jgi:hypothetical protein
MALRLTIALTLVLITDIEKSFLGFRREKVSSLTGSERQKLAAHTSYRPGPKKVKFFLFFFIVTKKQQANDLGHWLVDGSD